MTRGLIDEIRSPVPIGGLLPAVYQDLDPNVLRMTESFDAVIAPVWFVLDNLSSYFDPALAPVDFVTMLAEWVGLPVDDNWSDSQMRRLVADAVDTYRWRGTKRGVIALVQAYTGTTPDVDDSGGTIWNANPGAPAPGSASLGVRVRIRLPTSSTEDLPRLTRLISDSVPAHVPVTVEVVRVNEAGADTAQEAMPAQTAPAPPPPPPAPAPRTAPPPPAPRRAPPPPPPPPTDDEPPPRRPPRDEPPADGDGQR